MKKIKYEIFLFKENIKKSIWVSFFLIFLLIILFIFWGFFWFLFAFIVFFITLNSYFLKISYLLDEEGIKVKKIFIENYRKWKDFKKVLYTQRGLVLSPFFHKTYLDNFRGLHIFLPQNSLLKKEIIDFINEKILKNNLDTG
ncbi:MAG: hypothetical protein RMJ34_00580 [candidate division WOR-3 bacterium]|nr:hypothetical protein [candidate division WOR-3 bacterium]MDW8113418.1 hypothetical protein [candidate division WOR-3 bacterium]